MIDMTTVDKEGRVKIEPVILVPKDYVQVVRCKNCKWWERCNNVKDYVDGFCSDGERKEE